MPQSSIKKEVMRRVYFIYIARHPLTKLAIMAICVLISSFFVSFKQVLTNLGQSSSFFNFSLTALTHTEVVVQISILAGIAVCGLLVKDLASRISFS